MNSWCEKVEDEVKDIGNNDNDASRRSTELLDMTQNASPSHGAVNWCHERGQKSNQKHQLLCNRKGLGTGQDVSLGQGMRHSCSL